MKRNSNGKVSGNNRNIKFTQTLNIYIQKKYIKDFV